MKKRNVGILGAGNIANYMANTLVHMNAVVPYAVAAREKERAEGFAARYGIQKAYGSYREMIGDPAVDLIYIATPHSHHAEHMRQCLEGGKHVLCEKAFTSTAKEAREVFALAKQKGLLVTEAIWPRYMPMARTIRDFLASGKIGKIHSMTCNLGYPVAHVKRLREPSLAGGALLDVGVYTMHFASLVMGNDVKDVASAAVMNEKGVDLQGCAALTYGGGRMANVFFSVLCATDRIGAIHGEEGYALIGNINNFEYLRVYNRDHELIEETLRAPQITGFEYEVRAAMDAIERGALECAEATHADTLFVMELMDSIRHGWGMWYPWETRDI